jgi:hypothetical protein
MVGPMEAERLERQRLAAETQALSGTVGKTVPDIPVPIVRGFGEEYRDFPDEMQTDIDVEKLITHMKTLGTEVGSSLSCCYASHSSVVHRTCTPLAIPASMLGIISATISTTAL